MCDKEIFNPVSVAKAFVAFKEECQSSIADVNKFYMIFLDMYEIYSHFSVAVHAGNSVVI